MYGHFNIVCKYIIFIYNRIAIYLYLIKKPKN